MVVASLHPVSSSVSMQLVAKLEDRQRMYCLEVTGTYFTADEFMSLVVKLLHARACQQCILRGCGSDISRWERAQAFVLLSWDLGHSGQSTRMYQDDGAPFDVSGATPLLQEEVPKHNVQDRFWGKLTKDWVQPAKVCLLRFVTACLRMHACQFVIFGFTQIRERIATALHKKGHADAVSAPKPLVNAPGKPKPLHSCRSAR